MEREFSTSFLSTVYQDILQLGGMFNAHLHLDRAETLDLTLDILRASDDASEYSLAIAQKHALIPRIHSSTCYDPDALEARVQDCVTKMARLGTTQADSVVDVTMDRVGLSALDRFLRIADLSRSQIDFRVGAYSPLGFRDDEPERWTLIEQAAERAHFLGALPERDDQIDYPDHIGFDECCRRILGLAFAHNKPVHVHVDQKNHDRENHTERLIKVVREGNFLTDDEEPLIWLIHVISPSAYDDVRFDRLARDLASLNIGVICCPSAAISMRQLRPLKSYTHNCIARVLELIEAGVFVRLGTDNVCDITSPAGTLDLMDELFVLSNALRFYDAEFLAYLGAGKRIPTSVRSKIANHLIEDSQQCEIALSAYNCLSE